MTDLAALRAKLAAAERGEIGDPDPGQKVDHDLVDFLRFKIGQADQGDAFRREVAARDAARALSPRHAMQHAEALARMIRDAGGPKTTRAWQKPGSETARVYFPEPTGFLTVDSGGAVHETQHGSITFYPTSLYREWRAGVRAGMDQHRASHLERSNQHDAERMAAVAKVRGNPRRGPVRKRPPKTVPFNPRATRTMRRNPSTPSVPITTDPPDCAWCGAECDQPRPFVNWRGEAFCSPGHRSASNRALTRLTGEAAPKRTPAKPKRNPEAVPIASGLIVNPPVPTNDYRSGATRESTPLHIWWHNVLDLAGVTDAESRPHRSQVTRWYHAGEPAWMAADGLRLLVRKRR